MTLRGLARFVLVGALVGLLIMAGLTVLGWRAVQADLDQIRRLETLRHRATELSISIDYATMLRSESPLFDRLADDARALARDVGAFDEPIARGASQRLMEIAFLAAAASDTVRALGGTPTGAERLQLVGQQMRLYQYDLVDVLRELSVERSERVFTRMAWGLAAFSAVALAVAALGFVQATAIHRRLLGPVRAIDRALGDVAAGDTATRIPALRDDELGALARSFNRMMDERGRVEAELRQSEERFRSVATVSADVVSDWNLERNEVWWSDGMQRTFGHDPGETEASDAVWSQNLHPEDRERVLATFDAIERSTTSTWEQAYRFRRADGSFAHVRDTGVVLRDETGAARRMIGAISDLSERLDLEARLRQAQRLEAVGQLTGGVAHDFNNLLTVVLGNGDVLIDALGDRPDLQELARMITGAADRGAQLTQRLLAFSRRQALAPQPLDLNAAVRGMEKLLRQTIGQGIAMQFHLTPTPWPAHVDVAQFESAVLNLCLNARDAMPSGGRLTVETANVVVDAVPAPPDVDLEPGRYVLLAITDTGSGMDADTAARAFEPFFTTKSPGQGTGLGLSMVFGFVKQSRGQVRIYSEVGVGTTVKLYLPRAAIAVDEAGADERADAVVPVGTETILLVEDDALVRDYAERLIGSLGYTVMTAASGDAALAVLQADDTIDGLFSDVVMPGRLNGKELARAAKALRPDLPVLLTSAFTGDIALDGIDADVGFIRKPFRKDELARSLRAVLEAARQSVRER